MKFSFYIYFIVFFGLVSCKKYEATETYLPSSTENLVKVDLKSLKSKAISWELLKKYFFSGDDRAELPIDLDRNLFLFSDTDFKDFGVLLPIDDEEKFSSFISEKFKGQIIQKADFQYLESDYKGKKIFVAWNNEIAFLSNNTFEKLEKNTAINNSLGSLPQGDVVSVLNIDLPNGKKSENKISCYFETGKMLIDWNSDDNLRQFAKENVFSNTDRKSICFTTDSCIFGFSAKINPSIIGQAMKLAMPHLMEYQVLDSASYKNMSPYLDGRVYLGISKIKLEKGLNPEVKMAFGVRDEGLQVVKNTLSDYTNLVNSPYLTNLDSSKYVLFKNDYIVFSNHSESNLKEMPCKTLFKMMVNKEAINESLFTIPKMLYGKETIDNFPFTNLFFEIDEDKNVLKASFKIDSKIKEENSLVTIIKWLENLKENSEV